MRSIVRAAVLAAVVLSMAVPARAGIEAASVQGLTVQFRDGKLSGVVSAVRSSGASYQDVVPPGVQQDEVAVCVLVLEARTYYFPGGSVQVDVPLEFACGAATLTIADDLASATVKGKLRSWMTGRRLPISVRAAQSGDPVPFVSTDGSWSDHITTDGNLGELLGQSHRGWATTGLTRRARADLSLKTPAGKVRIDGGGAHIFRYLAAGAAL